MTNQDEARGSSDEAQTGREPAPVLDEPQRQPPAQTSLQGPPTAAQVADDLEENLVPPVIDTSTGKEHGLDKCPRCGSTEIGYSMVKHALVCKYCRHSWNEEAAEAKFGFDSDIGQLRGQVVGQGATDMVEGSSVMTLKCQGCGAEVIIRTEEALQSKCHWCRQVLSVNTQIPNGAVPDALLPFTVTHEDAVARIKKFVKSRQFFALKRFKREFVPENIKGVYLPYMMIDGNLAGRLDGVGEIQTRRYTVTVGSGDNKRTETRYDADVYSVRREFDFHVDDLMTESSGGRADFTRSKNTNNVINAVLPFDTKNAVAYNSNYLSSFTSERRDLNISDMQGRVHDQFLSIARAKGSEHARNFDRGVRWERESIDVHGTRWVTVYVPVWLYSYYEKKGGGKEFIHYIAVNGRNQNTMGSVPLNHVKLAAVSVGSAICTFGASALYFWL